MTPPREQEGTLSELTPKGALVSWEKKKNLSWEFCFVLIVLKDKFSF